MPTTVELEETAKQLRGISKQVLHQSKIKISLAPFENRTETIDGIAMLPLSAQEPTDALEGVASDRQLMLLRLLREMGSYDEEAVVGLLADKALRESQSNLLQRVVVDNCQEFIPAFRNGDLVELTKLVDHIGHRYKVRSTDPARSHIELDVIIEEGAESVLAKLAFPIRLREPLSGE